MLQDTSCVRTPHGTRFQTERAIKPLQRRQEVGQTSHGQFYPPPDPVLALTGRHTSRRRERYLPDLLDRF